MISKKKGNDLGACLGKSCLALHQELGLSCRTSSISIKNVQVMYSEYTCGYALPKLSKLKFVCQSPGPPRSFRIKATSGKFT